MLPMLWLIPEAVYKTLSCSFRGKGERERMLIEARVEARTIVLDENHESDSGLSARLISAASFSCGLLAMTKRPDTSRCGRCEAIS